MLKSLVLPSAAGSPVWASLWAGGGAVVSLAGQAPRLSRGATCSPQPAGKRGRALGLLGSWNPQGQDGTAWFQTEFFRWSSGNEVRRRAMEPLAGLSNSKQTEFLPSLKGEKLC